MIPTVTETSDGTEVAFSTDPNNPAESPDCESPILNGGVIAEFTSPDDLHLDPSTVLIAVDVYGDQIDEGREINGVTFFTGPLRRLRRHGRSR